MLRQKHAIAPYLREAVSVSAKLNSRNSINEIRSRATSGIMHKTALSLSYGFNLQLLLISPLVLHSHFPWEEVGKKRCKCQPDKQTQLQKLTI